MRVFVILLCFALGCFIGTTLKQKSKLDNIQIELEQCKHDLNWMEFWLDVAPEFICEKK